MHCCITAAVLCVGYWIRFEIVYRLVVWFRRMQDSNRHVFRLDSFVPLPRTSAMLVCSFVVDYVLFWRTAHSNIDIRMYEFWKLTYFQTPFKLWVEMSMSTFCITCVHEGLNMFTSRAPGLVRAGLKGPRRGWKAKGRRWLGILGPLLGKKAHLENGQYSISNLWRELLLTAAYFFCSPRAVLWWEA